MSERIDVAFEAEGAVMLRGWLYLPDGPGPHPAITMAHGYAGIKEMGLKTFHGYLKQTDAMLEGREWLSDRYSVLDPYALVFYNWGINKKLPVGELKNYTAHKDRLLKRPAVQRALDDEGIKLQAA